MTAFAIRPASARRLLAVMRWGGAAMAATALAALVAIGPPGTARAASGGDNYNQMTGIGTTASAVTVPWTQGLLNAQNQPITTNPPAGAPGHELSPNSDRQAGAASPLSATSPLSFMYGDFKNLAVTVSQTQNITHQGITVKWTGGQQTASGVGPEANFLQMMECYGDSNTGPSPENCAFGSSGLVGATQGTFINSRTSYMCRPGSVPSAAHPAVPIATPDPGTGCDVYEPTSEIPSHCDPQGDANGIGCGQGYFAVPFVPVAHPTQPIYEQADLNKVYDQFKTNEVQDATSGPQGSGQLQFDAQTDVEAPWLGCGALESNGQPRNCWLVIVPRGQYESNGYKVPGTSGPDGYIFSSPLSASNWAQRIQIHLSYAPVGTACSLSAAPRLVEGSQVITRAMSSWAFPLNQAAKCNRIYIFTSTAETQTTHDLTTAGNGVGMALTTIPIGSEAAREGLPPPKLPKILYAPVAVTALDFGFNIDLRNTGPFTTPINLTPRLLAKAITQVYRTDLPDYISGDTHFIGPGWSVKNPTTILSDPAFGKINSAVTTNAPSVGYPLAPILVGDRSSDNQRVWQWVQSDSKTTSWLDGTPDPADPVSADPDYVKFKLGKPPASDSFPQDYTGFVTCGGISQFHTLDCGNKSGAKLDTQYLLPVADSFNRAASTVLGGADKAATAGSWNPAATAPDSTSGWWGAVGYEPPGQLFMWAQSDTPDTAAYGLTPANLCGPSGGNCVGPSIASVTKALDSATTDSQGLLQVNPAKVPAGGFPLVDVVYAAVPTNQSAAALNDYADLIQYAAGSGQTAGTKPGDLPPGYLPLPGNLQAQAQTVVKQIRAIANPTPPPTHPTTTPTTTQPATTTQPVNPTSTGTSTSPGGTSGTTPGPTAGAPATPTSTLSGISASTSGSPSAQGPVILPPSAQLAGGTTQGTNVGKIRWVLIAVLIIGAAGALGGILLRSGSLGSLSRWRSRTRT